MQKHENNHLFVFVTLSYSSVLHNSRPSRAKFLDKQIT
jgi:hypothetical protein